MSLRCDMGKQAPLATSLCETEKASVDSTGGKIDSNNVSIEH